jgi:hypothetical protein
VGSSVSAVAELGSRLRAGRRRRSAIGGAAGLIGLAIVVGAAGGWNPWHLTYLDLAFTWPFLGVLFLASTGVLWHVLVLRWPMKAAGFLGLALGAMAVGGVAVVESDIDGPFFQQHATNPDNDVEVSLTSQHNVWDVWLRVGRGLLSREHLVARIGRGDSAPPSVEARFTATDELIITSDGHDVYRVRYDPGDLDLEDETCRPFQGPATPGCMP